MKTKINLILAILLISAGQIFAQNVYTVNADNYDISDNLDLKAVAYHFGKSKNLKKFEKTLNDPKKRISNLDLNDDGYIDYLRVVEANEGNVYIVIIQAVLGVNLYQDVATIDVDVSNRHRIYVQVVGNEYIYGSNYIIEPVYDYRPDIYNYFRYANHSIWYSPYTWAYYPSYYRYRKPYNVYLYHRHVYHNYYHFDCRYTHHRNYVHYDNHHNKEYRNDYQNKHPERSFNERNNGIENRTQLVERRSASLNTNNRRSEINQTPQSKSTTVPSSKTRTYSNGENSRRSERYNINTPRSSSDSKSGSVENNRRVYRSETSAAEPSTKSSSSSESRRVYTAPESTQKSAPAVYTKPAETRTQSRSATERKPATVKQSRSESTKPAVKSESSRRSSTESKPAVKQQKSDTQKSKSSEPKTRTSSSSKPSTEKSNGAGRR